MSMTFELEELFNSIGEKNPVKLEELKIQFIRFSLKVRKNLEKFSRTSINLLKNLQM